MIEGHQITMKSKQLIGDSSIRQYHAGTGKHSKGDMVLYKERSAEMLGNKFRMNFA